MTQSDNELREIITQLENRIIKLEEEIKLINRKLERKEDKQWRATI